MTSGGRGLYRLDTGVLILARDCDGTAAMRELNPSPSAGGL